MLEIEVANREIANVLPRGTCDAIIMQLFAAEGYQLREPDLLRYRIHMDDTPEQITLSITQPVTGTIVGKWADPASPLMLFDFTDLMAQYRDGQWPLISLLSVLPASGLAAGPTRTNSSTAQQIRACTSSLPPLQPPNYRHSPRARESRSIVLD